MFDFRIIAAAADWESATDLRNRAWVHSPITVEQALRAHEILPAQHKPQRVLVSSKAEDLAYFIIQPAFWYEKPGRVECRVFIPKEVESLALVETVIAELVNRALGKRIAVWSQDSRHLIVETLVSSGFAIGQRNPESSLNPQGFDSSRYSGTRTALEAEGYRIASLNALKLEFQDWARRAYALDAALMADVPLPEPFKPMPFPMFKKELTGPYVDHDAIYFAIFDGNWIGSTALQPNQVDPRIMTTGLTGVTRDHRRRGIAQCLKVESIEWAKRQGATRISTDNEEGNPMFQLNLALGFKKEFEWICFERCP